ncbi:glycosyl transferase, partial [bacterium]|nr:glycosyl transferase [bacterium]
MGDFFQNGMINTLHRLGDLNLKRLERRLEKHSKRRPVALVLPALYSDLKSPAMAGILAILKEVNYIRQLVLALAKAN